MATTPPPLKPRTKLTPELIAKAASVLRRGHHRVTAAATIKVSESRFSKWMARGESAPLGSLYRTFRDTMIEAEAAWETRTFDTVNAAIEDDSDPKLSFRAAAWALARRHPARWARKDNIPVDGDSAFGMTAAQREAAQNLFIERMTRLAQAMEDPTRAASSATEPPTNPPSTSEDPE